ncbi:MAG TPA: ABC transporter permease subunit [bacterium]|nr:ABC transporter permease subunit [bacterium]
MAETLVIAFNVFRQMLRNRILIVLTLCGLVMVGVVGFLGDLGQDAQLRLARDFGLMTLEAVGFFTVLLCHVVLLFEESELKTYNILLVKPVERWQVLLGRTLGAILLMLMNQAGMLVMLWLLGLWRGLPIVDSDLVVAACYLAAGGALFSAVTAFFSVLASSVPAAAMFATFTFALGHFTGNLLEWTMQLDNPVLIWAVKLLYWITPNFSLFNIKENLDQVGSSLQFSGVFLWPLVYGLCYGALILFLSLWRYELKDF